MATRGLTDTTTTRKPKKIVNAATGATASNAQLATAKPVVGGTTGSPTSLGAPRPSTRYGDTLTSVNSSARPVTASDIVNSRAAADTPVPNPYTYAPPATPPNVAGNPGGFNQTNTDPITGQLAKYGYTPGGLATLYDNPQALATDILAGMGIDNPGLAQTLSQSLDPAVAAQFLLNNGGNASDANTLNFAAQYMQNLATPNGRSVQFDALMNHLLSPDSISAGNPLGDYLNSNADPSQQVQRANALLGQSLVGQNPYFQQGVSNYAKDLGSQYQGDLAHGNTNYKSYIDYLRGTRIGQYT